jgi:hypothetical protein
MAKLDTEVRKALGLIATPTQAQPGAQTSPQAQSARVTTMPTAVPEPARAPIAAKR